VPFGTLLRELRIAVGLSQEALAEAAGVSLAAIGAYERGVRSAPHKASLDALADALGLSGAQRREFEAAARPKPRVRRAFNLDPAPLSAIRALPPEVTTFIGREAEIAEILEILSSHRALTITGPGGVGKTRVALRVAARQQRPDGVWFVDLGSVRDPTRVVAKILSVVPLPFRDEQTPEALAESLRDRSAVLVLDNCEHVLDVAGAVVAALLRTAPNVAVLATSRHRLNVTAEVVFRLAPLPYPDSTRLSARDARRYAAVELFVLRASAADQRFLFSDNHVAGVVEICRRVEGVPLAVELAAARLPMFGLTKLCERLSDRLDVLKSNVRDVPERQQTFRATIDWSYDLLEADERSLLQRLAIFAGGCTLEAAEEVCSDENMSREWIPEGLTALVDRSLISANIAGSSPRYSLLEATRQYALEKLSDLERRRLSARHAAWLAEFADHVRIATLELTHAEWTQLVLPEFDNVYEAIDWTAEHDRLLYARIVGSLYFMWWRIGRPEEGRKFAADALSQFDEDAHPLVAAQLHLARSITLTNAERMDATLRAVELFERLGEPSGLADAYIHLGGVYLMMRNGELLKPLVDRVSELIQRSMERNLSPLVSWLRGGSYALEGRFTEAREELLLALELPKVPEQEAGYVIGHELANVEYALGNIQRAATLSDELVAASRVRRLANHEVYALVKSAGFHLLLGDTKRARRAAHDALMASRQLNALVLRSAIQHLATIAALDGDAVRAARLHGYVDGWFGDEIDEQVNLPFACREILIARLDELLPFAEKANHMAAGALLSETAAIQEALQDPFA
jgi:predicted ATPase/DNA-binding XRE family transcriptional regulator